MPIATNPQTGETVYLADDGAWKPAQVAVNPQTKERLAFDGKQWSPLKVQEPQQSKGVLGYVDDVGRSFASGATFGYADEIAAKMNELTGLGGSYEENVAKERARDEQIPAAIAIPGQIGGAVASTMLGGPALLAVKGVRGAVSQIPNYLKYGGLGAVEGGIAGSGNATEGGRLSGAATGAAIGAPVGAAAPYAVQGVGRAVGAIRNAVSAEANVAADLGRAIARDTDNPAALFARANDQSIERPGVATLADAGGENVRGLVERVAQTPGAGRTQVVPALTQRQQGQAMRLANDLRSLTGTTRTAHQAITDVTSERAAAARPLYQRAYEEGDNALWSPGLERLTSAPSVQRAMRGAVQAWRDQSIADGFGAMNPGALVQGGVLRFQGGNVPVFPNLQFWDYTKRMLDDQVRTAINSGQGQKAQALTRITQSLREELDNLAPESYRSARDAWAGPSRYLDAIEEGRNILQTRVSAEELSAALPQMSAAEREGFRLGAISAIVGKMGNDSAKLGDMTKYLRSPEVRSKIAAIMPDQEAAATWQRRLDYEVQASELTGRALGNSATARRLAERQDAENLAGDLVMDALTGTPQSFIRQVLGAGPKWIRDTMRSRADSLLADVLTNPDGMRRLHDVLRRPVAPNRVAPDRVNTAAAVGAVAAPQ